MYRYKEKGEAMLKLKRPAIIALLILLAFLLALGIDALIKLGRRQLSPDECRDIVEKYASEYNVPAYIIFAIIDVESDFETGATSSAGARGLMQMMPDTFEWLTSANHLGENLPISEMYDAEVSIKYGAYYLKYLFGKFYDWDTVFAAYNAGEGNVAKWLKDPKYSDGDGKLREIPFKETRSYVKKINDSVDYYKNTYYKNEESVK